MKIIKKQINLEILKKENIGGNNLSEQFSILENKYKDSNFEVEYFYDENGMFIKISVDNMDFYGEMAPLSV